MSIRRCVKAIALGCSITLVAACGTAPPPPALVRPAAFTPLGLNAPYLYSDVIGGHKARAAKMKGAKVRPLSAGAAPGTWRNSTRS